MGSPQKDKPSGESRATEIAAIMKSAPRLERLASKGIRRNADQRFRVVLSGREVYGLLSVLEARAVAAGDYVTVSESVFYAEKIRGQVRSQGF